MARFGTIRDRPGSLWLGLALIVVSSLAHLWLEIYRGIAVAPQVLQGTALIAHTYDVIATAQNLDRALQDAERGQRSYLISGEPGHLRLYEKGVADVPKLLAQLERLTADNPEQQRRFPVLEQLIHVRISWLDRTLALRKSKGADAAWESARTNIGIDAMTAVDALIDATIATETALLNERLARATDYEREGRIYAFAGGVLVLAVLALGIVLVLFAFRNILRAEAARHEADRRFRLFVNGVTDYAIYMLDPAGRVADWNAGAERIKGYPSAEIIGQDFARFYTEEDRRAGLPQRALEKAARDGKYEEEGWRVRKDGTRFLASLLIEALHDASGRLVGYAKITRDIGELRRQQQALAQYAKMDALGQLTGGIAHDFNNLLHVIRNAIEIAQHRLPQLRPDVRKYLDMALRNVDRAAGTTGRLLAFSRRQVLDPKPIDPKALVADVTTLLKQALGESIAIETIMGAGVWQVSADANQLETAILNLALNARDAMAGSGKLTIEISNSLLDDAYAAMNPDVKAGPYVMIAVSDTGCGMTPEVAAQAFEPFFTTKAVGEGTGLGLSQVYGFIKQSGGHARIDSEPGVGTTVKLYLPRLAGSPGMAAPTNAPPLSREAATGTIADAR